jgi:hypothetical protein
MNVMKFCVSLSAVELEEGRGTHLGRLCYPLGGIGSILSTVLHRGWYTNL